MTTPLTDNLFLTTERSRLIGFVNAALLRNGSTWIHRRKESIVILDETALRRQVSVDFTLPDLLDVGRGPAVKEPAGGEPVYCAPLFVLPKLAPRLMSFDLKDEGGRSLPLMTKEDNLKISACTLVALAERILQERGRSLPPVLSERLAAVAEAPQPAPLLIRALERPHRDDPDLAELGILSRERDFSWWLRTLSHSSLVAVPYRDPTPRRKIFRLSYQQPIANDLSIRGRLGWTAYRVVVDSSWADARTYHFEAEAPHGLRIAEARLTDDQRPPVEEESVFLRRVHLYRENAEQLGAATASLFLRVGGEGFVGGALLATGLVVAALASCWIGAGEIAENPSSAPALLLLLPGLIASYVGRPSVHALTRRLLFLARLILLVAGGLAYFAAAFVALGGKRPKSVSALDHRTHTLQVVFRDTTVVAALCLAALLLAWLLSRSWFRRGMHFEWARAVAREVRLRTFSVTTTAAAVHLETLTDEVKKSLAELLSLRDGHSLQVSSRERESVIVRFDQLAWWLFSVEVSPVDEGASITVKGDCIPRHLGHVVALILIAHESTRVEQRARELVERCEAAETVEAVAPAASASDAAGAARS